MITRHLPISDFDGSQTIAVCGIERGGTSMVAAALHCLGINMGDDLDATYEDHELAIIMRAYISGTSPNAIDNLKPEILKRNKRKSVWGFKVPNIFEYPELFDFLRQPVLVCIFRDTVANCEGIVRAMKRDSLDAFNSVQKLQSELAHLFMTTQLPVVALSYEKAMADPEGLVDGLVSALRLSVSEAEREAAISVIRPSPADYLEVAGAAEIIGQMEGFDCGDLVGWVIKSADESERVKAEIAIDGRGVAIVEAGQFRPDLWIYCPNDLNHGFRWRVPRRYYDTREHTVTVNIQGANSVRIGNQPLTLKVPEVFGALEEFVDGTLRGWVHQWRGFTNELWVSLEVDNRYVSRTQANYPRDDLEPLGFLGAEGLAFVLPEELLDGQNHRVRVRVIGRDDAAIRGNPKIMRFPHGRPTASLAPEG